MKYKGFTYTPTPKTAWDNLSMLEKSEMMKVAVRNGITDLKTIREKYNEFAEGGKIHIKNSKKGTFTAAASRHNMGVQEFASKVLANKEDYSPAMVKKANFARNASKWHGEGGNLFEEAGQMQIGRPFWQSQTQQPTFMESLAEFNRQQEIKKQQQRQALRERINTVGKKLAEERMRETSVESNDNAWVETPLTYKKNPHLSRGAEEGAKAHAAWEKEHPVLNTLGTALGAAPFAVATTPLLATVGEAAVPVLTNPYVDTALTSGFGAHGLNHAINEGIDGWGDATMTALEVTPLGKVIKPIAQEATSAAKTLYDNGTLWDAYTTFGGRFGNYGDNIFTNIYSTAARRFGLPDKARVPADGIRKIKEAPRMSDGKVDFTGNKNWYGNPHVNATIDRGVVSHTAGGWDGADTYLFPFRDFLAETKGSLKSIEPSDVFSNGVAFNESPSKVTLISGDVTALENAQKAGMQTLSSPRLRRLYSEAETKYNANKLHTKHPKKEQYWKEYADEVQRLQSQRGVPTLEDFRLLEQTTGLKTGVAPLSEYENAIRGITEMQETMYKPCGIRAIMNGEAVPYTYPNGREVDWTIQGVADELNALQRAKYNNVFYDPTTYIESIWRSGKEPKW